MKMVKKRQNDSDSVDTDTVKHWIENIFKHIMDLGEAEKGKLINSKEEKMRWDESVSITSRYKKVE